MPVLPSIDFPGFHLLVAFGGNSAVLTDFLLEIQFQWDFFIILQSLHAGTCQHKSWSNKETGQKL